MAQKRPPPPEPTTDLAAGETPEEVHPIRLARILAEKWAALPANTRQVVREELAEGGVLADQAEAPELPQQTKPAPDENAVLEKFFQLTGQQHEEAELGLEVLMTLLKMNDRVPSLPALLRLMTSFASHVSELENMLHPSWEAWQTLSSNRRISRSASVAKPVVDQMRDLLEEGSKPELTARLKDQNAAVRLLLAVLTGLGKAGGAFSKDLYQLLDPEKIYRKAREASGKRQPTAEDRWQAYQELSHKLTPGEIESMLKKRIVEATEQFYHAAQHS